MKDVEGCSTTAESSRISHISLSPDRCRPRATFAHEVRLPHELALAHGRMSADTFQVAVDARGIVAYAGFFRGSGARFKMLPLEDTGP